MPPPVTTTRAELTGWGRSRRAPCDVLTPESTAALLGALDAPSIARGLGRSYGDPALNTGGRVLDLTRLDRVLAFDDARGILTCQAGLSLDALIRAFAPRGWFPWVTPGTKFVTVGGCIANDVHGKGHHSQGTFASGVLSMRILGADGVVRTVSRTEDPDLFWATFGGMGLVGVIVEATLKLRPIQTTFYRQRAIPVAGLDELLDRLAEHDEQFPYSVAWIDPLATGARLGQGVLTVGDHATLDDLERLGGDPRAPLRLGPDQRLAVPLELPELTLNPVTLRVLNAIIRRQLTGGGDLAHYEGFFYPLDLIGGWNRAYGPRGFTQYQFVVPREDGRRTLRAILETIAASGKLPFLNILKRLGAPSGGHLSFPMDGYTFAIDFPVRDGTVALTRQLDAMVLDAGGRLYLGKDAFTTPETFRAMYPRLDEWRAIKRRVDPDNRWVSDQARRLGLLAG